MPRVSKVLCTRRVQCVERGRKLIATITIGPPVKRGRDWACQFYVSNVGMTEPMSAWGVDGLQALTLALEGVRVTLNATGKRWSWLGMRAVPRLLPESFGEPYDHRLDRVIDAQIEELSQRRASTRRKPGGRAS